MPERVIEASDIHFWSEVKKCKKNSKKVFEAGRKNEKEKNKERKC